MQSFTIEDIFNNLKNGIHFSYSRYGDGEWAAILGKQGQNCDRHQYFPDMGARLKSIIESKPEYYTGMQSLAKRVFSEHDKFHVEFKRLEEMNEWCPNELVHHISIKDRMGEFYEALEGKKVLLVGNESLSPIASRIGALHAMVPHVNCWNVYGLTRELLYDTGDGFDVILYSASMMTNVLIDDVYNKFGNTVTQIDTGSMWSPYIGVSSRSYHPEILKRIKENV